jgi:hypothetical protein
MTTLSTIRTFGWFAGSNTSISSIRTHGWFFDDSGAPGFVFLDVPYHISIELLAAIRAEGTMPTETLSGVSVITGNNLPIDYIGSILEDYGIPIEIIPSLGIIVDQSIPIEILEAAILGTIDSYHLIPIEIVGGEQIWIMDRRGVLWSIEDCGLLWIRNNDGAGWTLPERN